MKNFILKLIFSILTVYITSIMIYHDYLKERQMKELQNLYQTFMVKRMSYTNKKFKTSTKSQTNIEKDAESH